MSADTHGHGSQVVLFDAPLQFGRQQEHATGPYPRPGRGSRLFLPLRGTALEGQRCGCGLHGPRRSDQGSGHAVSNAPQAGMDESALEAAQAPVGNSQEGQSGQQGIAQQTHGQKRPPGDEVRTGQGRNALLEDDAAAFNLPQGRDQAPPFGQPGPWNGKEGDHGMHPGRPDPQGRLPAKGQIRDRDADEEPRQGPESQAQPAQLKQAQTLPGQHAGGPALAEKQRADETGLGGQPPRTPPEQGKKRAHRDMEAPHAQHPGGEEYCGQQTEPGLGQDGQEQEDGNVDGPGARVQQQPPRQGHAGKQAGAGQEQPQRGQARAQDG